jgi:hypothetical protein
MYSAGEERLSTTRIKVTTVKVATVKVTTVKVTRVKVPRAQHLESAVSSSRSPKWVSFA